MPACSNHSCTGHTTRQMIKCTNHIASMKDSEVMASNCSSYKWNSFSCRCYSASSSTEKVILNTCGKYGPPNEYYANAFNVGDTINSFYMNHLIDAVNHELYRRKKAKAIDNPEYIDKHVVKTSIVDNDIIKEIDDAIAQMSKHRHDIPADNTIIYANNPLVIVDDLRTLMQECFCYGDCGYFSACVCYGHCNDY